MGKLKKNLWMINKKGKITLEGKGGCTDDFIGIGNVLS